MALPATFRSSVELLSDDAGHRLRDAERGAVLSLSPSEATMLQAWDGVATAAQLAALLQAQGRAVEPTQVEQFFARLHRTGLLESAPAAPPPATATVETEEDPVPLLRGDLVITASPTSRGTREVADPRAGRSFTLYDFEVSIARMLDGRRTAGEVITAATRLGIPVTLPTLKTFLSQLGAYQFLDTDASTRGSSTWAARRPWTVEARELHQSALRLLRAGKLEEARGYLEALVAADPDNEEAPALRARLDAEAAGQASVEVPFDALHAPIPRSTVVYGQEDRRADADAGSGLPTPHAPLPHTTVLYGHAAAPTEAAPEPDPFASFGFNGTPPAPESLAPLPDAPETEAAAEVAPPSPPHSPTAPAPGTTTPDATTASRARTSRCRRRAP